MRSIGRRLQLLPHLHWGMFLATLALLGLGVAFVYSACYVDSDAPVRVLYRRQLFWAAAGLVVYAVCALGDYRRLRHWAWTAYAAALALLVLVLLAGVEVYGARRWLPVMGVKVQPSEFAKLALVLILAKRLARPGVAYADSLRVGGVLALSAAPMLLILKQPDLGTAAVVVPVTLLMMLAAGVPLRVLLVLVGIGLLGVGIVLAAALLPERLGVDPETAARWRSLTGLSDYQFKRILVFFQADADPLGAGWNRLQSEIAVGSGGLWGKGYLRGTQNILGFLPRSVAPTDFIFSVIAEELGFGGSALVLGLFGVLCWGGMRTAAAARDKLGRLLCVGVTGLLFCHVFVNIAMTVGLMPITGLPLPLLSYGGSFMLVVMAALGLVQSVHIRSRRAVLY